MIKRGWNWVRRDRTAHNTMWLWLGQVVGLLIPLVTFPWLTRALGTEGYGSFAFSLAFVQYFAILVDYGFQFSATRRVAELRSKPEELERFFWQVQGARLLLVLLSLSVIGLLTATVPQLRENWKIIWAATPLLLANVIFPSWLFAGLERLGVVTVLTISGRLLTILPLFVFVHDPDDAWRAALISSANGVLAGLAAAFLVRRVGLIGNFHRPSFGEQLRALREGWHLFVSQASISFYSVTNTVLLGFVSTERQVGLFTAADRVKQMSLLPIDSVANAFYPRISRMIAENDPGTSRMLRNLAVIGCGGMTLVSAVLFFGAPLIVRLLMGPEFGDAVLPLRILSVLPILVAMNTIIGRLILLPLGRDRSFSRIIFAGGLLNLMLLAILAPRFGAAGVACSLVATELFVTLTMIFSLRKLRKLLPAQAIA
jgi:PST family polysaccharide transporter